MAPPLPDPRPKWTLGGDAAQLAGARCRACRHPLAVDCPACPACGGELAPCALGPGGTVWSFTTVHVAIPGREPPYQLAYVDLDEGPRVLAHVDVEVQLAVGTRVHLAEPGTDGDLRVEVAHQ